MRQFLVSGEKEFRISVPEGAKVTFGPWSPPKKGQMWGKDDKVGTLRIYQGTQIIAVFSNVTSFRADDLSYSELVAKEEGASIWKSDENGYSREEHVTAKKEWIHPQLPAAPDIPVKVRKRN